ncbi:hypothetical protein TUBRATIS_28620 [Tubulinosema ratisbonensis]|uniref:Uncharacterized protein n=1 Tax=Tubulinosema ratisbonensis TaxID=291195 RepID=A0A437AHR8_9MICR|nr:hypothetical protein TUBRATIS_28620 [Tubulinosema ratisbonensis]
MLPGFVHSKKQKYKICKLLTQLEKDIKDNQVKNVAEYLNSCESDCEAYHKESILSYQLKTNKNIDLNFIKENLTANEPNLRFLSLKILLKNSEISQKETKFYLNDSFYKIRCLILKNVLKLNQKINLEKIKELIKDENFEVRKLAIKCLLKFENKNTEFICKYITDKNKEVRILAAKSLKKLKIKDFKSLFSKNENGAFIYGLEDENHKVRLETLKSISCMCNKAIKDEAFDFLTYLLSDEREELRLVSSKILKKLSKKFLWKIPSENLKLLLLTLEDKNRKIVKNILNVCGNLIYSLETFFIFNKLVEKLENGKNKIMFYNCIKKIVSTNLELFNTHSNEFSDRIINYKKKEVSTTKDKYIANLIVLSELNKKEYDFEEKLVLQNEFNFLKIKLHKEKGNFKEEEFLVYKNTLLSLLNNLTKDINFYKKFFYKNYTENNFNDFFCEIYKAIKNYKKNKEFRAINYVLKKYNITSKEKKEIFMIEELKEIISNLKSEEIKNVFFMVNIFKNEIYSLTPILDCKVRIATNCKNGYFLRIKNDKSGIKCYYKLSTVIHLFLQVDNLEDLSICVVKKEKEDVILTTPEKLINKLNKN